MVYVGIFTRNSAKVMGVERAFKDFFNDVLVEPVYVDEVSIPKQPMSLKESLEGALKRAQYCFDLGRFQYSVGVEGGLHEIESLNMDVYVAYHVAVVIDECGCKAVGISSMYQFPNEIVKDVADDEMASVLAKLTNNEKSRETIGFIGYISDSLVTRVDLAYESVRNAIIFLRWSHRNSDTL